jgi:hypothetical protein
LAVARQRVDGVGAAAVAAVAAVVVAGVGVSGQVRVLETCLEVLSDLEHLDEIQD